MKRSDLEKHIEEIIMELLYENGDPTPYGTDSASKNKAIKGLKQNPNFKKLPTKVQKDTENAIKNDTDGGVVEI